MKFVFNDAEVPFVGGQTVGAALSAAGIGSLRTTRVRGRPRAMFCGIGICFDCLVCIDGLANQRACLVLARDGMRVESQEGTGRHDIAIADV
jgi:aerobic-type carbon monoxide dehydrogenase small subunit (CoxS/CutS family)